MMKKRSTAGFTLVELMVALTAGAIAITSVYYLSSTSSQHFHEQQRVAQVQMGLRMAMDQLRADISRAAFLGTPNSANEQGCVPPVSPIVGVTLLDGVDTAALDQAGTNGVEADGLRLVGNYATGDGYFLQGFTAGGNQAAFQTGRQLFRRSFGVPYDQQIFEDAFAVNRWIHIRTTTGNHFFNRITAVDGAANPPTVTFTPAVPIGGACTGGLGTGSFVAPIVGVEYRVVAAGAFANLQNAASPLTGVNGPVLIRREFNVATGVAIANTERVVAEYVADFDVDFVVDTGAGGGAPVLAQVSDAAAAATLNANPERARTALIRLSVRTAAEDPLFPYVARGGGAPLIRYELDTVADGAARVRTATAEVFLPNFVPGL